MPVPAVSSILPVRVWEYIVANLTISEMAGIVSRIALPVDYMLTITVSIAACGETVLLIPVTLVQTG